MLGALGPVMIGASAFVFFAILAGFALNRIIGWYIDGSVSGLNCILTAALYIGVIVLIITSSSNIMRISLSLFLMSLYVLLPVLADHWGGHNTFLFNEEKIEKYRQAVIRDPGNLAAKSKLADVLYEQGRLSEAIDELRQVVQRSPGNTSDAHRLKYMENEIAEKKAPPVTCPSCGQKNPAGQRRCSNCEGELSMGREIRKWLKQGALRQIVVSSSTTVGICAVVMFTFSIFPLLFRIWIVALLLLILISAEFLYIHKNW